MISKWGGEEGLWEWGFCGVRGGMRGVFYCDIEMGAEKKMCGSGVFVV